MVADLLDDVSVLEVRGDATATPVSSVEFDSRRVGAGALFCCVPGERTDGHAHAAEAVERGATSLLCEHFCDVGATQVRVAPGGARPAMASVAAAFWGHPARTLQTVGVTGTNGKTTVTQLVRSILEADGRPTGVVGTLDGARTTPEAPDLHRTLAGMVADGRRAVAMEVSSHALTQHRVDGIVFDVAAFTNLSRDHLDHHGTMEAYFEAKASLFLPERCRHAVVFAEDRWGARLLGRLRPRDGVDGYRVTAVTGGEATEVELTVGGSRFAWQGRRVALPLTGRFNVDNALVAAAVATALGVDGDRVAEGLAAAAPVPGRMEVVGPGAPVAVLVDYAHTPAGLEVALDAARVLAGDGRVLCVFGCGGDRDAGKRPEMGAVATARADEVVLTSDNPRSEDPLDIIGAIRAGAVPGATVSVEPDRAAAIRGAVGRAHPGDVVLVAGKGHEETQTSGGVTVPFDDRTEAARALVERFGGGSA
jgi:UDP-N-acetylmuramoyl-L-alanyl-D-glutamate--2,6-diaminopimelate ligase